MRRSLLIAIPAFCCSFACADDGGGSSGGADGTGTSTDPSGDGDPSGGDGDGDGDGDGAADLPMDPDLPPEPAGCVVHVKPNGNDALLGLTWLDAKASLQAGLDAAADLASDDEACAVWVAEGTYRPTAGDDRTVSFELRPNVWVYGGFAGTELLLDQRDWVAHETVLSGDIGVADDVSDNSHHIVIAADNSRLDGFTITGGNSQGALDRNGVGIQAIQVGFTLAHSRVIENFGGRGGDGEIGSIGGQGGSGVGLFQFGGALTLDDVEFRDNVAGDGGDGLSIGGFGGEGAGAFVREVSSLVVRDSRFIDNRAGDGGEGGSQGGTGGPGAGLEIIALGADVVITGCLFEGNVAGQGGPGSTIDAADGPFAGLYYSESSETPGSLVLANSELIGNVGAFGAGAGLLSFSGAGAADPNPITVVNTVVRGNTASVNAGGLFVSSNTGEDTILLANLTITDNSAPQAGGLQINTSTVEAGAVAVRLVNSVVWGNQADFVPDVWTPGANGQLWASVVIDHVDVGGGCPDTPPSTASCGEVLDVDPQFVAVDDLHLQPSSPLVDAGDAALLPADVADLDGDRDLAEPTPVDLDGLARVVGGVVDLGAYELP